MTLPKQPVRGKESGIPTLVPISPPPSIHWKIITLGVTGRWNLDIKEFGQEPYVYIGLSHLDYLAFTAWLNELIIYLKSQKVIQKNLI